VLYRMFIDIVEINLSRD